MVVQLDFSTKNIDEIKSILLKYSNLDWINGYAELIAAFESGQSIEIQTSGTTGSKKTYLVEREKFIESAQATNAFFQLNENSVVFSNLSHEFIAGKLMLIRAMVGKYRLDLSEPSRNPSSSIQTQYNFAPFVPLQIPYLLKEGKINQFDCILIGGGKIEAEVLEQFRDFKVSVYESFGMTETLTHFALRKRHPENEGAFTTIGAYTVDETEDQLLIVKHPQLKENIITNDFIQLIDNKHFNWLGRSDNLINSGGVKIIPEEVESQLSKQIHLPFVIIGLPNDELGECVGLIVEGESPINLNNLNLSEFNFNKPRVSKALSKFPRTTSGKIIRHEIKKHFID